MTVFGSRAFLIKKSDCAITLPGSDKNQAPQTVYMWILALKLLLALKLVILFGYPLNFSILAIQPLVFFFFTINSTNMIFDIISLSCSNQLKFGCLLHMSCTFWFRKDNVDHFCLILIQIHFKI